MLTKAGQKPKGKKMKRTGYLHNSSLGLAQILRGSCTQSCQPRWSTFRFRRGCQWNIHLYLLIMNKCRVKRTGTSCALNSRAPIPVTAPTYAMHPCEIQVVPHGALAAERSISIDAVTIGANPWAFKTFIDI